jgi:hypothetical protein
VEKLADIVVRLSEAESRIINNTLLMATDLRIDEADFEGRLGGTREDVRLLLDGFRGPRNIGRDGRTYRFGPADLLLLRNAMVEITNEGETWPGEYSARIGADVAEGKRLLAELEALLAG